MKLHLDKTTAEVFWMLPERDRTDFDKVVAAFDECFKPFDIEELRGLEFHHKSQGNKSMKQLGIFQQLGCKVFSSMSGKEFD